VSRGISTHHQKTISLPSHEGTFFRDFYFISIGGLSMIGSKSLKTLLLIFALILGAAALAAEQDDKGYVEAGQRWLALMNHKGDKDNTISKKEFDTYINTQFDLADTDHDGTLNAAELGHFESDPMREVKYYD
jgi:hypothetical protein